MPVAKNLEGQKFGKLTAVSPVKKRGVRHWICRCECGGTSEVLTGNLIDGNTTSCGKCYRGANTHSEKHGHRPESGPSPTYRSWRSMLGRCRDEKRDNARFYVGAGIGFDPRWASFEVFLRDMGVRPEGHTLDRIDNTLGYTPSNCRWATPQQQTRNRRNTIFVKVGGEMVPVAVWAASLGLNYAAALARISRARKAGRPIDHTPIRQLDP